MTPQWSSSAERVNRETLDCVGWVGYRSAALILAGCELSDGLADRFVTRDMDWAGAGRDPLPRARMPPIRVSPQCQKSLPA